MESSKLFFRENPFPASPSPDHYLAIGSSEAARARMMESIDRREGPGLIIGPPGTGKSLLCMLIASAFKTQYDVVLLSETRICTRKALLQHLLHHLGLPFSDRSEGELRLSLIDRAASGGPDSRKGVLIIVDEAQTLPGRLLEELRMMSGIVRNGSPRVQLVLAGGPSLDERLAQPRMEALSQRIGARCYLHPLGQNETAAYIRDAFRRSGANPQTSIDDSAIQSAYYASSGIIRLINQTMSRTIAIAQAQGCGRVTASLVEQAWADLQQLPSPIYSDSNSSGAGTSSSSVVEFGSLDEEFEVGAPTRTGDPMAETTDYEPNLDFANPADDDDLDEEVDERQGEMTNSVTDLAALFGEGFEDEQVLTFNAIEQPIAEVESLYQVHPLESTVQTFDPIGTFDLEQALHDEIVALNCEAIIDTYDSISLDDSAAINEAAINEAAIKEAAIKEAAIEDASSEETLTDDSAIGEFFSSEASSEYDSINDDPHSYAEPEYPFSGLLHVSEDHFGDFDDDEESIVVDDSLASLPFSVGRSVDHEAYRDDPVFREGTVAKKAGSVSDITIRDDSDMLIIEDDVDVDPVPQALSARAPRVSSLPSDDCDFQAIFARLREG
jgi:type II secretory pathway predicted ATPase ExeA